MRRGWQVWRGGAFPPSPQTPSCRCVGANCLARAADRSATQLKYQIARGKHGRRLRGGWPVRQDGVFPPFPGEQLLLDLTCQLFPLLSDPIPRDQQRRRQNQIESGGPSPPGVIENRHDHEEGTPDQ